MTRLPLTVVSGYLGAGKTTLINRLLGTDHGLRLMVLVNDFGSINIDETLLATSSSDTVALTNGCVCCTMDSDLFTALGDALDRSPRPDHLIVEASGIADPAAIANAALAEPDLSYAGIVTLVDALNIDALLADSGIAPQVIQQITAADLILMSKTDTLDQPLTDRLRALGAKTPTLADTDALAGLLFDLVPLPRGHSTAPHPGYATWHHVSDTALDRRALGDKLATRPDGLYRLKGFVLTTDGPYEVHVVGQSVTARRAAADQTRLVALGPSDRITTDQIETWWAAP